MVDAVMLRGCSLRRFAGVFARVLPFWRIEVDGGIFIASVRALLLVREGVGVLGRRRAAPGVNCSALLSL